MFEKMEMIEHDLYRGFYKVPFDTMVVVSKEGRVIDTTTGRLVAMFRLKDELVFSVKTHNFFKMYELTSLIALTFVARPIELASICHSRLHVIHMNNDNRDNRISNLQWCTLEECMDNVAEIDYI